MEISLAKFHENYTLGDYGSIDETTVKFKGRSILKQYIPLKPLKRGYKICSLCNAITALDELFFVCAWQVLTPRFVHIT
jgi:hypothetical protein